MTATLFASDLHLSPERPAMARAFFSFLRGAGREADAVYFLGDLFDYWPGDDDDDALSADVVRALGELSARGVALYVMHGNRDFLLGAEFAKKAGVTLIEDPTLVGLYGARMLLMHGDTLCTDDVAYLEFRRKVRAAEWQREFLAQPLAARREMIAAMRAENAEHKKGKTEAIMDAAASAVEEALRAHGYPRLIHGHTHRPALHHHTVDGRSCERWVLADWYRVPSYLHCDASGCRVVHLPPA
jgi:UDP-2,3-diacylglucosamine hydrolase